MRIAIPAAIKVWVRRLAPFHSIASHSQLLSERGKDWSREAMSFFGIPRTWLEAPVSSPRRLGPVLGIPELANVISVMVPGHDTACAFAAMPASADGTDLYLSSGTWSLLGFESETPLLGPEVLKASISNERMGDGHYRPLKSCLGLWLLERILPDFNSIPRTSTGWKQLIAGASRAPAPGALLSLGDPNLSNPPSMRAAIDAQ